MSARERAKEICGPCRCGPLGRLTPENKICLTCRVEDAILAHARAVREEDAKVVRDFGRRDEWHGSIADMLHEIENFIRARKVE